MRYSKPHWTIIHRYPNVGGNGNCCCLKAYFMECDTRPTYQQAVAFLRKVAHFNLATDSVDITNTMGVFRLDELKITAN